MAHTKKKSLKKNIDPGTTESLFGAQAAIILTK